MFREQLDPIGDKDYDEKCELCNGVKNSLPSNSELENTILFESEHFLILPSIGPLVKGHVLIVSKRHYLSLLSMPDSVIEECFDILLMVSAKDKCNFLFTEHGSFNNQSGGACISHTHIHIIPDLGNEYSILDGVLPFKDEIQDINDLKSINPLQAPYILNINSQGNIRLYEAYNSYSQMMRKAICSKYPFYQSDWRKDPNTQVILDTVNSWKNLYDK